MKFSDAYRQKDQDCLAFASDAGNDIAAEHHKRMADAWYVLANEQDWLDGRIGQMKEAPTSPMAIWINADWNLLRRGSLFGAMPTSGE